MRALERDINTKVDEFQQTFVDAGADSGEVSSERSLMIYRLSISFCAHTTRSLSSFYNARIERAGLPSQRLAYISEKYVKLTDRRSYHGRSISSPSHL